MTAYQGGAIYVEANSLLIKDSVFEENKAMSGGAAYILKVNQAEIKNTTFRNNMAIDV